MTPAMTDTFTADHAQLWEEQGMDDVAASSGQTLEQARIVAAEQFQWACDFNGLVMPSIAESRGRW